MRGYKGVAIAMAGTLLVVAGEIVAYQSGRTASASVLNLAIALAYLYGGLAIYRSDPRNRTGVLMLLIVLTWQIGTLSQSSVPLLSTLGIALGDTSVAFLFILVLAYPEGRFETARKRNAAILLALGVTGLNVLQLVPVPIWINVNPNGFYVGLLLAITAIVLIIGRWASAPPSQRAERVPVLVAGIVLAVTLTLNIIRRIVQLQPEVDAVLVAIQDLAPAAIPIALLIGFYRSTADELRQSRARIVEATDVERRRLERDLHDGAQQRLVSLALGLRLIRTRLAKRGGDPEDVAAVDQASTELKSALAELRELARGIHPAVLTQAGLGPAISALADRSTVPATVDSVPDRRLSDTAEATAYFVVSEALANVAKHSEASKANVAADYRDRTLTVVVSDDGHGGADGAAGSGLRGLRDRVASVGGSLSIVSPLGRGTTITARIPSS